jgi:DNA-binding transcriptional LysR family regulator
VIAKRGHPVTRLKSPTAKQLAKFKWILSSAGNLHRKKLEHFFESSNVPMPDPVAETSSPTLIKSLVLRSGCIALMAKMGVQPELDAGIFDFVKINSLLMIRSIGLLWRSNHPLSAAAQHVIHTIEEICLERGHRPRLFPKD